MLEERRGGPDTVLAHIEPGAHLVVGGANDEPVTEYGVAELRGISIRERTERLIAIAYPEFRDELESAGRELGYL
jgi:hypothetical protein